ncbi:MAG: molybdate ABC transporter substrate-binding protein [Eubacteriales bacterium]|nr:molybdate ABC transporter substrate-binding protein [Eubacteriales bacterium]
MLKKAGIFFISLLMLASLWGCSSNEKSSEEKTKVTVFAAKSLNTVLDELIVAFQEEHPDVEVIASYDSSGTLMEQIREGAECDIFFSAATKQMDQLEEEGLVVSDTRKNVVNNQVCVVTYKRSDTKVKGLDTLSLASSLAIADGSVPVGKYTRQALVNAGILPAVEDVSLITSQEISQALDGTEINECANVGAVAAAVSEGSNEAGTVYKSDTTGYEDKLEILEIVSYDLTGNVIYPIAQIENPEASDSEKNSAKDLITYLTSDSAKEVYEKYYFDTNVE